MFNNIKETIRAIKNIWFIKKYPYKNDFYVLPKYGRMRERQFNRLKWEEEKTTDKDRKKAIQEFVIDLKKYYKDVFVEAILDYNSSSYFGIEENYINNPPFEEVQKIQKIVDKMWEKGEDLEDAIIYLTFPQIFRVREILTHEKLITPTIAWEELKKLAPQAEQFLFKTVVKEEIKQEENNE